MKYVEYWEAEDGTKFENEEECLRYERVTEIEENHLEEMVRFFDSYGEEIPLQDKNALEDVDYISIKDTKAIPFIVEWFTEFGIEPPFTEHSNTYIPGVYYWDSKNYSWENYSEKVIRFQELEQKMSW